MSRKHLFLLAIKTGPMLQQVEEDSTSIIDWMLTRKYINDFTSSHNNVRTLLKKFPKLMLKRNQSVNKRCYKDRTFVSWQDKFSHYVGMVMELIQTSPNYIYSEKKTIRSSSNGESKRKLISTSTTPSRIK